jgi:hypothetical protein
MEHVDIRIESILKTFIEKLVRETGRTTSEVTRDLVRVGLGIQMEGGIDIVGPLGFTKPLAEIDLEKDKIKMAFWIDEEVITELVRVFHVPARRSIRQAIRYGALACNPGTVEIRGKILGIERPFATIQYSEIRDARAREALERLRQRL